MTNVRDFGAKGDGMTDDSVPLQHAIERGDGDLSLPRGDYLLRRTLTVPLEKWGRFSLSGSGGTARILWAGAGPALHLIGTHKKTADPTHFVESVWKSERMPTVRDLEIVATGDGDGIRLDGVMQPTLSGLLIRRCRHAIHLVNRNRNVLIADCHLYDQRGIGIFLDHVNLHQINIHGNHISYCRQGGIVVSGGEVRNIQICSNDIEYNFAPDRTDCADVWLDAREGTIREGTISGNTIQAKVSPGGTNVRLTGPKAHPEAVGMIAITGNLIGSQETLVRFEACRGVTLVGNSMYHGEQFAVLAEDSEHLVLSGNSHDHNSDYKGKSTDLHRYRRCRNLTLTGLIIQYTNEPAVVDGASIEVAGCQNVSITGCQVLQARTRGIRIEKSEAVRIAECTIRGGPACDVAVDVDDASTHVTLVNNFVAARSDPPIRAPGKSVNLAGNIGLK